MSADTKRIEELRKEYRKIQRRFLRWVSKETLDEAVREEVAKLNDGLVAGADPELWVKAIKRTTVPCDHCPGDGTFRWGAVINGKPSHSGKCFHCAGKGRMSAADCARTATYHEHIITNTLRYSERRRD